jgi:hypothetical protein
MPTCEKCGMQLSERETLSCSDCQRDFCREHYHGHDCDSTYEISQANPEVVERKEENKSLLPKVAYGVSLLSAAIGALYLLLGAGVVFVGGGLQELSSLIIAGAFFSLSTFLLVGGHILEQPTG